MSHPDNTASNDTAGKNLPSSGLVPPELGPDGTSSDGRRPRRKWPWILGVAVAVSAAGIGLLYAFRETVLATVLINLALFASIGLAMAIPVILLVRFTRPTEPWGQRHIGLLLEGLRGRDDAKDRHSRRGDN